MSDKDDEWFEGIFSSHSTAVYRFFVRRADRDDAQDLTADVFATAWRRRGQLPRGAELPWLYKTAGFILTNHRRKMRPTPITGPALFDVESEALTSAQWPIDSEDIRVVLESLTAKDQQILLLSAWDGLGGAELAEVLGISRGGADAALSRARSRLREAWALADAS